MDLSCYVNHVLYQFDFALDLQEVGRSSDGAAWRGGSGAFFVVPEVAVAQRAPNRSSRSTPRAELASAERGTEIRGRSPWYPCVAAASPQLGGARGRSCVFFADRRSRACSRRCTRNHVAHTGPNAQHVLDRSRSTASRPVVSRAVTSTRRAASRASISGTDCTLISAIPIGPQWFAAGGKFVLGADAIGRDVAVRLLYGGRTSLFVGIVSSAICTLLAIVLALLAGYFGGSIGLRHHALLRSLLRVPGRAARHRARRGARGQRPALGADPPREGRTSGSRR